MADSSEITSLLLSFFPRVLRSPTDSLAPRNMPSVAGSLARPSSPCAPFPVSPLSCHRSDTRWSLLWLATVRCSIVGLRPFSLPLFHPALRSIAWFCGSSLSLALLAGLLPQVTTFDHCFTIVYFYSTSTSLHNYMLMANSHQVYPAEHTRRRYSTFGVIQNMQHLPTYGTNGAFLFGRLTCVLSALPTSPWSNRPRNRLPSPAHALSGRLQRGWCCFGFLIWNCCFTWKNISSEFATFHLGLADRRATARTMTCWAMQHPDKKISLDSGYLMRLSCNWTISDNVLLHVYFLWKWMWRFHVRRTAVCEWLFFLGALLFRWGAVLRGI